MSSDNYGVGMFIHGRVRLVYLGDPNEAPSNDNIVKSSDWDSESRAVQFGKVAAGGDGGAGAPGSPSAAKMDDKKDDAAGAGGGPSDELAAAPTGGDNVIGDKKIKFKCTIEDVKGIKPINLKNDSAKNKYELNFKALVDSIKKKAKGFDGNFKITLMDTDNGDQEIAKEDDFRKYCASTDKAELNIKAEKI